MRCKEVLRLTGLSREHLCRLLKLGKIKGEKLSNGQYVYDKESVYAYSGKRIEKKTAIYGRVSTQKQKKDLERQMINLEEFCIKKGERIDFSFEDIASGINFDKRKHFFIMLDLIIERKINKVFITYKDRLSRVGFDLFKRLFGQFSCDIIVINEAGNKGLDTQEVFEEIVSLLHCFSMKMYSKRAIKRIKDKIKNGLQEELPFQNQELESDKL